MPPGHHARSISSDRRADPGSRTNARSAGHASKPPAPAEQVTESRVSCRYAQSPAKPARRSESRKPLQYLHDKGQGFRVNIAIDNNPPSVQGHDLDPTNRWSPALRRVRNNNRRNKATQITKPAFSIRLAPRKQELVRDPMTTCRCRRQTRARKALLDNTKLLSFSPATAPTGVNNRKAADMTIISKDIHTDSQLYARKSRKAAFVGCVPVIAGDTFSSSGQGRWRLLHQTKQPRLTRQTGALHRFCRNSAGRRIWRYQVCSPTRVVQRLPSQSLSELLF